VADSATEVDESRYTADFLLVPGAYERIHEPHNDGVVMMKLNERQAQELVDDLRERFDVE
jgi:hypothetical protein